MELAHVVIYPAKRKGKEDSASDEDSLVILGLFSVFHLSGCAFIAVQSVGCRGNIH